MIRRRWAASNSFVLTAARLRALQLDPFQHGDANQAAAKKIPEEQSGPARRHRIAAGPMTHTLLTQLALMGAAMKDGAGA
jgi:hypothetical protein